MNLADLKKWSLQILLYLLLAYTVLGGVLFALYMQEH